MKALQPKQAMMICATAAAALGLAAGALAFPEPSIVPKTWEFDIEIGQPKPVSVRDIDGKIRWYWYLTYMVANNTGQERLFIPEVHVATDEGDLVVAGQNVPPKTFDVIKKRERNPLLLSPLQIVGRLLQGEDFVKEGVAIWPAFGHPVDRVDVFIAGLSGETTPMKLPGREDEVVLRKTMMVKYHLPGGRVHPDKQNVEYLDTEWVMR